MSIVTSGAGSDDDSIVTMGYKPGIFRRVVIRLRSWIRKVFIYVSKVK